MNQDERELLIQIAKNLAGTYKGVIYAGLFGLYPYATASIFNDNVNLENLSTALDKVERPNQDPVEVEKAENTDEDLTPEEIDEILRQNPGCILVRIEDDE